jgi:hypothetical protein
MMNLKILRLTGVASALLAISLTQAAEEASPKTDGKNEPNTYQEKFMKRAIEISRTALTPARNTSCKPCPLSVAAIGIARVKKMDYAAARDQCQLRLRIPANDPSVTADLDTQEEYAHWHSSAGLRGRR